MSSIFVHVCQYHKDNPGYGVEVHPLVLQQLVVLAELAQLRAKAAVLAAQGGELTSQLRLQLPVGLKIRLQSLHVLLQP